ncbi:hypothetical protein GWK36_10780 [Caldichromatium japonicum]|uniref:Uncharacterized protein n=1 Tax=Caldichromatium japonicum TaxID=2699430 RepID=A0A6G7VE81_9GAMM|nr:hypothetical protein [Caldichromatium japonicum]QIK38383.1 hypothetical protein GWK36_10780 [Caldichromatium japonicum]
MWTLTQAFGPGAEHYADSSVLRNRLSTELRPGDRLLVKGLRAARMEQIVAALCTAFDPPAQPTEPDVQ